MYPPPHLPLQNQWDGASTVSKQKDKEIENLVGEKKKLMEKLKERDSLLDEQEKSSEKLRSDLNDVKQGYSKLDHSIGELKRNYVELEKR